MGHLLHRLTILIIILITSGSTTQGQMSSPEGKGTISPLQGVGVQRSPRGTKTIPSFQVIHTIEKDISDQAKLLNVSLTEAAQDSLIKAVSQEFRYSLIKGTTAPSAAKEASETFQYVKAKQIAGRIGKPTLESIIEERKIKSAEEKGKLDIIREAAVTDSDLTPKAKAVLNETIRKRTEKMAKSGLAKAEIVDLNRSYLKTFFSKAGSGQLNEKRIVTINKSLFRTIISLKINSEPVGALVELVGVGAIGKIPIARRPLEPGKEYTFIFQMQGYKTATRKYTPEPYPDKQDLLEPLIPKKP